MGTSTPTAAGAWGDALTGHLRLAPGRPLGQSLVSSRPDVVERLTRGRLASSLPDLLGSLFSLCGHAHRLAARLAVAAARSPAAAAAGLDPSAPLPAMAGLAPTPAMRQDLARATLRDHLQRLWLDAQAAGLAMAPPGAAPPEPSQAARWLQQQVFGLAPATWLRQWQADPLGLPATWAAQGDTAAARTLHQRLAQAQPWNQRALAPDPTAAAAWQPAAALRLVHPDERATGPAASGLGLPLLAAELARDPGFARRPLQQGRCAETGTWTRRALGAPVSSGALSGADAVTWRLGHRLAELARLVAEDGRTWLDLGACALGPGQAIAWVEMARGLLVHRVLLDGCGSDARVLACQVLAPTEWNFHPAGPVAAAVSALPAEAAHDPVWQQAIGALVLAYDPCVAWSLTDAPTPRPRPRPTETRDA